MNLFTELNLRPGQYQWVICDRCRGNGKHDHPAFDNGITSEEWERWDYEEREDYMAGKYDVQCDECSGSGKVPKLIPGRLDFGQLRQVVMLNRRAAWQREAYNEQKREMQMLGEW